MTFRELLQTLWGRRRIFAIVAGSIFLLAILVTLIWPKTYVSEAAVVVDSKTTDPVSGLPESPDALPGVISTEVDVISSHKVARRAVEKLKLAQTPEWRRRYDKAMHPWLSFMQSSEPAPSIEDWIADKVLMKLLVTPSKTSHVILIAMGSDDPQLSADLANAFADSFIETSLDLKMEPARRQAAWFNVQIQDLKKHVEAAQAKLSDFQRVSNVVGTNDQIDVENTRLSQIDTQLIAAQVAMYDAQTRLKQMNEALQEDKLQQLPDIEGNPLLQTMKANLAVAEGRLAQVSSSFGNNHPDYLSAEAQVKELRAKLLAEVATAKGAISQTAAISARQESELRRALDQQRDRILALKRQKDQLDVLKRDVDEAQQAYDAAVHRTNETHLESQLDQSNIAILNVALPPQHYAKPKAFLNLLLGAIVGLLFGGSAAIISEQMSPRVRFRDNFAAITGIVLLAEIPPFNSNRQGSDEPTIWPNRLLRQRNNSVALQPQEI
jgi:chain length determinant protein EpsF